MASADITCLRDLLARSQPAPGAALLGAGSAAVSLTDVIHATNLSGRRRELEGKSVLLVTKTQLATALALVELDGVASRLVVCPPEFPTARLELVIAQANIDAIVCDDVELALDAPPPLYRLSAPVPHEGGAREPIYTEWALPTSGTTGAPRLAVHGLAGLLGAIAPQTAHGSPLVWATFYDIRRYGGLQIFLRAISSGVTLVLSDAGEPLGDHLVRLRDAGATHISGTPSHWRWLLMNGQADMIAPVYIRLSGEIADRAVLDALAGAYPKAEIVHAFATTEAGVAFEVSDGDEGFPASILNGEGDVELRVKDGSLRIRSPRAATRYIGRPDLSLVDEDGFVDTEDMVELRGDRYYFMGRRHGVINVGGLKVHPEEIEQVINRLPDVSMSLVKGRRNPIMGDVIVASVVLKDDSESRERRAALKKEIFAICREHLERYKVPAIIEFVPTLDVGVSGKMVRPHA